MIFAGENLHLKSLTIMDNLIENKSFEFAVRIVKLVKYLKDAKSENVLSSQLLRSGTSIGANVTEAENAQSKKDFVSKLSIALKEANETYYWLKLLYSAEYISENQFISIESDCKEVISLLVSIINTTKKSFNPAD